MSTIPGASPAPQTSARTHPVHMRMLIAAAIAAIVMGSPAMAAVGGVSGSSRPASPPHASTGSARSSRPNRADWEKIKTAARLRTTALAPHRTARFRAFAANLGLSELISIHPLARGPCATAVIYLYNNLLDLDNAYPGENWTSLRRAVATEPSIDACAPRPLRQHDA